MKLERGINLGGYLSQCVHSTEHYDAFIQEEDIRKIASMGFDHVRLAIDYEVLEDEYGRTREEGFAYVTRVVECVKSGSRTLKDATNEAIRTWAKNAEDTFYIIGSAVGPHPYPQMVKEFQRVISVETKKQILEKEGRLPDCDIACRNNIRY